MRDRGVACHLGEQLCGLRLVGGEGDPDVAVRRDRLLLAVDPLVLREVLRDEHRLDVVAGAVGQRLLEELELAEAGKLVEHQEERVLAGSPAATFREVHSLG